MGYQLQLEFPEAKLQGFKYFKLLGSLFDRLHPVGTKRDKAHNRKLFFDHYAGLLLLYFFNPVIDSLRGVQRMTELAKVQNQLQCQRISLASLSEAGTVFDPEPLHNILLELAQQVPPAHVPAQQEALRLLTAVDGTLLPALPRIVWALWQDETHHAAKLHLQFEVMRGIPVEASVTNGNASEGKQLRNHLEAGRLYVQDRGYVDYGLLAQMLDRHASFIARLKTNTTFTVSEERTVSPEAKAAGVIRDCLISRLGAGHHRQEIHQVLRIIEIRSGDSIVRLVTDRLEMPAELIALAYRYRWTVELFFRWFKCILDCRHWLGESLNALTIQVYAALICQHIDGVVDE